MKLGIMQPYFFPYLGYWQALYAVDKYILLDDVTFIKQGFINRNSILNKGQKQTINIQINGISSNKLINHHKLNPNTRWKKKLLSTIQQNYSKAPFKKEIFPIIETAIQSDKINLSKYLAFQINKIAEFLDIKTEIVCNSDLNENLSMTGTNRILNICARENATKYINLIGGQKLYSKEIFDKNGVDLKFIKMRDFKYKQFSNEFVPYLSIIDVMMFNSKAEIKKMLTNYTLI